MSVFLITLTVICNFISVDYGKYILVPIQMHWFNASLYCQDMGTSLASIHSEADNEEAIAACNETCTLTTGCPHGCWLGLNDIKFEGIWEWDDGSITDYGFANNSDEHPAYGEYPWAFVSSKYGPEPNNWNTENCVLLHYITNNFEYRWNDIKCTDNLYYPLFNRPQTSNPTNNPTLEPTFIPSNNPTTNPSNTPTSDPTETPSKSPTLLPLQSEYSKSGSISNPEEMENSTKASLIVLITMGTISFLICAGFIIWRCQRSKVPRMLNVVSNEEIKQFNNNKKGEQSLEAQPFYRQYTNGEV